MEARELRKVSIDEYIALDRASEERWEDVDGEAFAMAGASMRDNAILTSVIGGDLVLESIGVTVRLDAVYADLERIEP